MIEQAFDGWKLKLVAFALPLWLAVAPDFCRWAHQAAFGARLPALASELLQWSYAPLLIGIVLALIYSGSGAVCRSKVFAEWFLLGSFSMPLAFLLSMPFWTMLGFRP